MNADELFGDVIHRYTRANAIEDGVLVDVSEMAREAGIAYPVALTRGSWEAAVAVDSRFEGYGQSESGRLWDVLWMYRCAAKGARGSELRYSLLVLAPNGKHRRMTLRAVCGPGDQGEPVITIMLPDED